MILNLNGSLSFPLIHQRRALIEFHFRKLPETLDLVRPFFYDGEKLLMSCYQFLTPFYNTDGSDALYGYSDNCCNEDLSLSYKLWLFRYVRQSRLLFLR